jgi:hypothetical protein
MESIGLSPNLFTRNLLQVNTKQLHTLFFFKDDDTLAVLVPRNAHCRHQIREYRKQRALTSVPSGFFHYYQCMDFYAVPALTVDFYAIPATLFTMFD